MIKSATKVNNPYMIPAYKAIPKISNECRFLTHRAWSALVNYKVQFLTKNGLQNDHLF